MARILCKIYKFGDKTCYNNGDIEFRYNHAVMMLLKLPAPALPSANSSCVYGYRKM